MITCPVLFFPQGLPPRTCLATYFPCTLLGFSILVLGPRAFLATLAMIGPGTADHMSNFGPWTLLSAGPATSDLGPWTMKTLPRQADHVNMCRRRSTPPWRATADSRVFASSYLKILLIAGAPTHQLPKKYPWSLGDGCGCKPQPAHNCSFVFVIAKWFRDF